MRTVFGVLITAALIAGCDSQAGMKSNGRDTNESHQKKTTGEVESVEATVATTDELVADFQLTTEAVSALGDTAVEAVAAEEGDPALDASPAIMFGRSVARRYERERACSELSDGVQVQIDHEMDRAFSLIRPRFSMNRTVKGEGHQTRVWKQAGKDLECDAAKKRAVIDWKNVDGLSLDLTFERSRENALEAKKSDGALVRSTSFSFSAKGHRLIQWNQSASIGDGAFITRSKKIATEVERQIRARKTDGTMKDLSMSVRTSAEEPLSVVVVRQATNGELKSKTIESGRLTVARFDGATIETTFRALKIDFDAQLCHVVSGGYEIQVTAKGAVEPSKKLLVSFEDGVGTILDQKTGETREISAPMCDPEDAAKN